MKTFWDLFPMILLIVIISVVFFMIDNNFFITKIFRRIKDKRILAKRRKTRQVSNQSETDDTLDKSQFNRG
jgi:hypothetical protein